MRITDPNARVSGLMGTVDDISMPRSFELRQNIFRNKTKTWTKISSSYVFVGVSTEVTSLAVALFRKRVSNPKNPGKRPRICDQDSRRCGMMGPDPVVSNYPPARVVAGKRASLNGKHVVS